MATKRDLVEAQAFSRRRLLTAFVSGAPGGQELEPTKPMRGVVAGVVLSVLVVIGSVGWGLLQPKPNDWQDDRLVVVKDSGARYVSQGGTLYPVLNTTSARLAIEAGSFDVIVVSPDVIADAPRGRTVGIEGAPDSPPAQSALVGTGWTACVAEDGIATHVGVPLETEAAQAVVVQVAGETYVVADGVRHHVPATDAPAVLRSLQLDTATPVEARAAWLNLFPAGSDLAPLEVEGAGSPAPPGAGLDGLEVGTVVRVGAVGVTSRTFVVLEDGALASLSEFAGALYALGSGALGAQVEVAPADIRGAASADPLGPDDWPQELVEPMPAERAPCAVLSTGTAPGVSLVSAEPPATAGVDVVPGGGAVFVARTQEGAAGAYGLLDETGRRFGLPGATSDTLLRLGYTEDDVVSVPPAWAELFAPGPELTPEAAFPAEVAASATPTAGTP